jgi:hypothetical protein
MIVWRDRRGRISEYQMIRGKDIRVSDGRTSGYQSIRWKDIRLSEYQEVTTT